ncbi:capsular polysaccharide export protein, LipB/KpsS family [Mariluticola halotolerans]|uniref:capsular polysaccharide export protein, LipB/KpsS family n=1 Tax=Mariluticola halotolerans TaxID=2909283 RepID=UPI0026E16EBC|nr:hypothetical protein [Mariluticola halotolerans]UJQ96062.1 hypothetical protein L1P08_16175 [Mariluticola halotolerans]
MWDRIARSLKADKIISDAHALVVGRNFWQELDSHEEQVFSQRWLLQDALENLPEDAPVNWERLAELEETYRLPSLNRFVWADRNWIKSDYAASCRRLIAAFDFYEGLYATSKPDFILTSAYASMPHLVGHYVARRMGIPIMRLVNTRIDDLHVPGYSALDDIDWLEDAMTNQGEPAPELIAKIDDYLTRFRTAPERPSYEVTLSKIADFDWGQARRIFRYSYRYWISKVYAKDHTKLNPFVKAWRELKPKINRQYMKRWRGWATFSPDVKYVYFPLHLQPEGSTMTLAPFYLNQISVVENISKSLPANMKLVVKEHPQMLGRRPKSYYESIKQIFNVELIEPFTNNFSVIKNADLVFTITGTAGWEALVLKKPVITLGATIYNQCPLTIQAGDVAPTGWADIIRHALNDYQHDETELRRYIGAIMTRAVNCRFIEPMLDPDSILSDKNVNTIRDAIVAELERV